MYQKIHVLFVGQIQRTFWSFDSSHNLAGESFEAYAANVTKVICRHSNICYITETGSFYTLTNGKFVKANDVEDTIASISGNVVFADSMDESPVTDSFMELLTETHKPGDYSESGVWVILEGGEGGWWPFNQMPPSFFQFRNEDGQRVRVSEPEFLEEVQRLEERLRFDYSGYRETLLVMHVKAMKEMREYNQFLEDIIIVDTCSAAECLAELASMEKQEGFEIIPTPKFELPDGRVVWEDDLKIVQGIGPKIEGILHQAGIITWKDLGETSVGMLEGLLYEAGNSYRIHDPATWPRQARMAAAHEWQKLLDYQEEILG